MTTITGVDTHAHIFRRDLPMASGRRYTPAYDVGADEFLTRLDAQGLSHGVLVQPSFLGTDNGFILDAIAAHPDRLTGIAVVDRDCPESELDRLARGGIRGVRLNLVGKTPADYAAPEWQAFFGRCAARGFQVEIQRAMADFATIVPPMLEQGVNVVIDHFGLPGGAIDPANPEHEGFLHLLASPQVWVKISAAYRAGLEEAAARDAVALFIRHAGDASRLIWGSDWPHTQHESETTHAAQTAWIDRLLAKDAALSRAVLIDNPARLFALGGTSE